MSAVSGGQTQRGAAGLKPPLAVPRRILRMRSDSALAERFAAGDETAFDVIYERHRSVVLAVSMGVLGTTQDAEDATQETFSALAVALHTKPPAELRPWLIRVARNASIDTTRRRRHRLLTLDGEIPEIPARQATAGQAELAVVLDGIRELPEGQRMALLMRELGGHSYTEIADFLETDEEAVKGLIARARVGLRTYREATELPCATARTAIAAEPDGRRYDKTVRRHLRTCAACRSYRAALRDDAKVLRAALPLQTGSVATGGISTGMLTAAKGTLIGYGLTQAATTCAASACAVGAIGGMVLVTPVHRFGLAPLVPAAKTAAAPRHHANRPAPTHTVALAKTQSSPAASSAGSKGAAQASIIHHRINKTSRAHHVTLAPAVEHHHHDAMTVTRVTLPNLSGSPTSSTKPTMGAANPTSPAAVTPTNAAAPSQVQTPTATAPTSVTTTTTSSAGGTASPDSQGDSGNGSQSGSTYGASTAWAGNGNSSSAVVTGSSWQNTGASYGSTNTSTSTTTTETSASTTTTDTSTATTPTSTSPTETTTTTPSQHSHRYGDHGSRGNTQNYGVAPATDTTSTDTATADTDSASTDTVTSLTTTATTSQVAYPSGWGAGRDGGH